MPVEVAIEREAKRELGSVIRKLQRWSKEIAVHHEEIARRNFAIGLEIHGFIETYPPRRFPELELMDQISNAVGLSASYLKLLSRIAGWLYQEKGIRAIVPYMRAKDLANWSSLVDHYFILAHGKSESKMELSRRWLGTKSSVLNLRAALPRSERASVDKVLGRLERIVKSRL